MVQTILPKVDLTYDDIRDTLNANGGSVTNDVQTAFSEKANINRWAKYKPVVLNLDFTDLNPNWWKGKNLQCGFIIKIAPSINGIVEVFLRDKGWQYQLPTGSELSPYRLTDFGNYDPSATPLVKTEIPERVDLIGGQGTLYVYMTFNERNSTWLSFSDILLATDGLSIGDWYPGFVYYSSSKPQKMLVTASTQVKNEIYTENLSVQLNNSDAGTMHVFPVLSQKPYINPTNQIPSDTYLIPMPNSNSKTLDIRIVTNLAISLDETSYFAFVTSRNMYQFHGTFNIFSTYTANVTGEWWYTPVDENGRYGQAIKDPNIKTSYTFEPGEYSDNLLGTLMYIPADGLGKVTSFIIEFKSEQYPFRERVTTIRNE